MQNPLKLLLQQARQTLKTPVRHQHDLIPALELSDEASDKCVHVALDGKLRAQLGENAGRLPAKII